MIAGALLRREAHGAGQRNYNRWLVHTESGKGGFREETFPYHHHKDNWVRFIVHQLLLNCRKSEDLLNNNIHFITFNYDNSLEAALGNALKSIDFLKRKHVEEFLDTPRIIHMYGRLGATKPYPSAFFRALAGNYARSVEAPENIHNSNQLIDSWFLAGEKLKVIDPHTKSHGDAATTAKAILRSAQRIYFLGFGFDQNNLERILPPQRMDLDRKEIFLTNFGNTLSINKRIARAFGLSDFNQPNIWNCSNLNFSAEKSARNTYEAIELDFSAFAE
jgi:hypothetical protein